MPGNVIRWPGRSAKSSVHWLERPPSIRSLLIPAFTVFLPTACAGPVAEMSDRQVALLVLLFLFGVAVALMMAYQLCKVVYYFAWRVVAPESWYLKNFKKDLLAERPGDIKPLKRFYARYGQTKASDLLLFYVSGEIGKMNASAHTFVDADEVNLVAALIRNAAKAIKEYGDEKSIRLAEKAFRMVMGMIPSEAKRATMLMDIAKEEIVSSHSTINPLQKPIRDALGILTGVELPEIGGRKVERTARIVIEGGVTRDVAQEIPGKVGGFGAEVFVTREGLEPIDAKTFRMYGLRVERGDVVRISAEGDDAEAAVDALLGFRFEGKEVFSRVPDP